MKHFSNFFFFTAFLILMNPTMVQAQTPTITPSNLILCPNETDTLWTQNYDTYQWFRNGNPISGANQQYYVVDYSNSAGFNFSVEVTLGANTYTSPSVLVDGWAFLFPYAISGGDFSIGQNGETLVCPGDTAYFVAGPQGSVNIQWTFNGNPIPGANQDTLYLTASGFYSFSAAPSVCPNYIQQLGLNLQVLISGPPQPLISFSNGDLSTVSGYSYEWYQNGQPLGHNNAVYPAAQPGSYTVIITDANGCSATSAVFVITGRSELSQVIQVFHHSGTGHLEIIRADASIDDHIIVTDITGRLISRHAISAGKFRAEFDPGKLQSGIYLVSMNKSGVAVKFFVD